MRNIDSIKNRVQKLLDKAHDQQGLPEGDLCLAKAVDIMARYGFDERDLKTPNNDDEIISRAYKFAGAYTQQQGHLLLGIAEALHCKGFIMARAHSNALESATVFGARRHIERVDLLYTLLNPMMLTLAQRADVVDLNTIGASTVVRRRSFMRGFIHRLANRLREAEGTVADDGGQYAVALRDDAERARSAYDEHLAGIGVKFRRPSRVQFDRHSADNGAAAADTTDIGQARVSNRPALTA